MRLSILKGILIIFIGWVYYQYLLIIGVSNNISDFSVFYASSEALHSNSNPYSSYVTLIHRIPNLNPPVVIMLFNPMIYLRYDIAIIIWSMFSLLLGGIATLESFKIFLNEETYQNNRFTILLLYLVVTPTLINFFAAQVAGFLFFVIVFGYKQFLKGRQHFTGLLWGLAMAIKLFPGLFLIFSISQKNYKTAVVMVITSSVLWLLPLLFYGSDIYHQYFQSLSLVQNAYSNWNVSLYGFITRIVMLTANSQKNIWIDTIYLLSFCSFMVGYLIKLKQFKSSKQTHKAFCLTMIMMLILAPVVLGYYFMLLLFPMIYLGFMFIQSGNRHAIILWSITFLIINFATRYRLWTSVPWQALTYHSFYFYGALLSLYLLCNDKLYQSEARLNNLNPTFIIASILAGEFLFLNVDLMKSI